MLTQIYEKNIGTHDLSTQVKKNVRTLEILQIILLKFCYKYK